MRKSTKIMFIIIAVEIVVSILSMILTKNLAYISVMISWFTTGIVIYNYEMQYTYNKQKDEGQEKIINELYKYITVEKAETEETNIENVNTILFAKQDIYSKTVELKYRKEEYAKKAIKVSESIEEYLDKKIPKATLFKIMKEADKSFKLLEEYLKKYQRRD